MSAGERSRGGSDRRAPSKLRADLAPDLPPSASQDCRMITRALVEVDVHSAVEPPADLEDRIVRGSLGYLRVSVTFYQTAGERR